MLGRKTLFATAAAVALASPAAARTTLSGQMPFDPKPSLSAKAATDVSLLLNTRDGATSCNPDGWCMIPRMPVLNQTDPAVVKALAAALHDWIKANYPQAAMTWQNPGNGKYYNLADTAEMEADVGCSLTSETMLVEALLARAPKIAIPTGKDKDYVDAPAIAGLTQEQSRLTWQYLQHLVAMLHGQKDGPGLLYVSQAAPLIDNWNMTPSDFGVGSDGGPDDMAAVTTDFRPYSMATLAQDIRNTGLTRLSFHWSRYGVVYTDDGIYHVVRMDLGQHKIALRGYNRTINDGQGIYPILANDPGSGKLVKIRLTTNPKRFNTGYAEQHIEYDFYDPATKTLTNLGPENPGWMAMIYEGAEPSGKGVKMDVGLSKQATMFPIQFVNGITTTFTTPPPPSDPSPLHRIVPRRFFPLPTLRSGSGPVERRFTPVVPVLMPGG